MKLLKQTIPFMTHMIYASSSSSNTMNTAAAFIHQSKYTYRTISRSLSVSKLQSNYNNDSSVCDVSSDNIKVPDLVNTKGSATILRNYNKLKNASGKDMKLGECMGADTSIIVFLRHLA